MQVLSSSAAVREAVAAWRATGQTVGFVPTMGALHEGHLSLVRASVAANARTTASIFVNPLQFAPTEDLDRYPRDLEGDLARLEAGAVDLVFTPTPAGMYPPDFATRVAVDGVSRELCGRHRPGHFEGVATVVSRLFNMVRPDRAYFGAKDFQQVAVVRRLVEDLAFALEVKVEPTVREADGLAMSSRNQGLSPAGRGRARALSRGLRAAVESFRAGERDAGALAAVARAVIQAETGVELQYCEVMDAERITPLGRVEDRALLAVAAFVEGVRLIDNVVLGEERLASL
jgi:pantoate--beta-alanine ligase